MKIKTGDTVVVISGKYKTTKGNVVKGEVLRTLPAENKVVVKDINMQKKHQKPQGPTMPGGIIESEGPIHVSKVMYFCEKCDRGVRVGYEVEDNGKKHRVCKKCGVKLD